MRRPPVCLEGHSKFSQALQIHLQLSVRKGCFFHGISVTIRLYFKYMCIIKDSSLGFCQGKMFSFLTLEDASEKGGVEDRKIKCLLSLRLVSSQIL